jgi:prolipoprotein diacylglyceryltransferase
MTDWSDMLTRPYTILYMVAVLTAVLAAVGEGRRRGWPAAPWLAVLAASFTAGIIGSKLLHFDPAGSGDGAVTILGGVLAGALTLVIVVRFVRFDPAALDGLILAAPLGFAIGRLGCLLAGCCFGHPTDAPWGVAYGVGTQAFQAHVGAGLIDPHAAHSLFVHPTQLYEAAAALLVAAAAWRARQRLRQPGSAALAGLALLAVARGGIESLRARETVTLLGFSTVQWLLALLGLLLAAAVVRRERAPRTAFARTPIDPVRLAVVMAIPAAAVLAVPATALLAGRAWFSAGEAAALLVLAVVPPGWLLLRRAAGPIARHWRAVAVMPCGACAAVLVLQAPPDSTSLYPRSYWTAGGSLMNGAVRTLREVAVDCGDSCSGCSYETHTFDSSLLTAGASISHTHEASARRVTTVTFRAFGGTESIETSADRRTPGTTDFQRLGVAGTLAIDGPSVGVTFGGAWGRLPVDDLYGVRAAPVGALRVGSLRALSAELALNTLEPMPLHVSTVTVGLGMGIDRRGSRLQAGVLLAGEADAAGEKAAGAYVRGRVVTARGFEIEPFAAYGTGPRLHAAGIGVRQRFGERRAVPAGNRPVP